MTKKITIGILVVLVVVIVGYFVGQSESLQGRFGLGSPLSSATATLSLSSSSPSGNRTVSASDEVIRFNLTAPKTEAVTLRKGSQFRIGFQTEPDSPEIDTESDGLPVYLYAGDVLVGTGEIEVQNVAVSENWDAHSTFGLTSRVDISAGSSQTFSVVVNTDALLNEDAGVDDPLYVDVLYVAGEQSVDGNVLNY